MGILDSYRVVDCSIAMAGPFAAQRLGDLGADVIKVEPVTRRVAASRLGRRRDGQRDQRVVPLAQPQQAHPGGRPQGTPRARRALRELVADADVFLQNYRPGVAERLGVDYETLAGDQPAIVYVSISGLRRGRALPRLRPGQDLLLQAMSGAMLRRPPRRRAAAAPASTSPTPITAYTAFEGVLAALLHRERTGEGQLVRSNMLDAIIALQMQELSVFTVGGVAQERSRRAARATSTSARPYGVFATPTATSRWPSPTWTSCPPCSASPSWPGWTPRRSASPVATRCSATRVRRAGDQDAAPTGSTRCGRTASGAARSTTTRRSSTTRRCGTTARSSPTTHPTEGTSRRPASPTGSAGRRPP